MKRIAILVLISILGLHLCAQSNIDSLWVVYRSTTSESMARLLALRELFDIGAIQQRPHTFSKYVDEKNLLTEEPGDRPEPSF